MPVDDPIFAVAFLSAPLVMFVLYHSDQGSEPSVISIQFLTALAEGDGMFHRVGWNGAVYHTYSGTTCGWQRTR